MGIAVTGGLIPFDDILGVGGPASPSYKAGRESRACTRTGIVTWASIDALLAELFPPPPAIPGTLPGITYLYASDVDINPWPPSPGTVSCVGSFPVYQYAIVRITYDTLKYSPSDLIDRKTSFSTDVHLLPANGVQWEDTGEVPQQEDLMAAKQVPIRDISLTYHRIPSSALTALRAAVDAAVGHVNQSTFKGFAAETLLYKGAEESWRVDSAGNESWTFHHTFQARMLKTKSGSVVGWNHFFRNGDSDFYPLVYKGTATRMYPLASGSMLNALFT